MKESVELRHVTRIEGHGNITAEIEDGVLRHARFSVVEAPRFFEAFLRGRHYRQVTHMASRICGICAISHACAALKATEEALGISPGEQTRLLRRLAMHGEMIGSHVLHVYFLAGPDFFGVDSVFSLLEKNPQMARRAMRLKKLGYDLSALVAGRHTHPVTMTVGGFTMTPPRTALEVMKERLRGGLDDLQQTVPVLRGCAFPELQRDTEYVSLSQADRYAFDDGDICASDRTRPVAAGSYRSIIEE